LIMFSYLMQSFLLARVNCLGLIPPKHGVIFPKIAFFNFHARNYVAYI
jgi:hypothetical protein